MMARSAPMLVLIALIALAGAPASEAAARPPDRASAREAMRAELGEAIGELARERIALSEATVAVRRVELPDGIDAGTRLKAVELASRGRPVGWVTARARVATRAGERDLWVKAEVEVLVPTLVAARELLRGELVGDEDVKVIARPLGDERLPLASEVVGAKVRRALANGDAVALRDLERPLLVERGDTVKAIVAGERFELTAPAEALEGGALGDSVRLRLKIGEKKVVQGVVSGARSVELPP